MIVAGGDTVPPPYGDEGVYEGEVENELAASYMEPLGFDVYRLWTSNGNLKDYKDMVSAINNGSGFFFCSGHGTLQCGLLIHQMMRKHGLMVSLEWIWTY